MVDPVTEVGPYVGLRSYGRDDAGWFFGRARETWELTSLIFSSRLVVVYGQPGVGKTSLLQAGVLAGLGKDMAHVLPIGRPPRRSAFATTSTPDRNPFTFAVLSSWAPEAAAGAIGAMTVAQFVQNVPVEVDRYGEPLPVIAIIDQFETVFSDVPQWADHRKAFLDDLANAVTTVDRLRLVLVTRKDAVGEVLPYESRLSAGSRKRFRLEPLDPDAALEAVTGPLRSTPRSFAPGVAEALISDLRTTTITNAVDEQTTIAALTIEPAQLQVVCSALWRALPDDVTVITTEHLQSHGDVDDILTEFCMRAVGEVADEEGVPTATVWTWLVDTFVTDLGTRGAAYEGIASTNGMLNAVARGLEKRRILRSERRSGSVWFELLHDGLIESLRRGRALAGSPEGEPGPGARPDAFLRMAETEFADGNIAKAEENASLAVAASQQEPRTLAEAASFLAKLAVEQGRGQAGERAEELYTAAEEHYRQAAQIFDTEQNPRAVGRVLASLGRLFRERGRTADAIDALQSALRRTPGDLDIRMDLARALADAGQQQAALGQYGSLLTIAPESVEALIERAALSVDHGDPASALTDIENAIRLEPQVATRNDVVTIRSRALVAVHRRS